MLTIFSTPKPFDGHIGTIQRNAIQSWKALHPNVEVILFGDDEGAAEAARDLGIRHEPEVPRNERGVKFMNYLFDQAQRIATHELLCYANCDIILLSDFRKAVERTATLGRRFLMTGRRWNLDVLEPWDFSAPGWEERLRRDALARGAQGPEVSIDYFVFSRGFYRDIPPFTTGLAWDHWLVWRALAAGAAVVDATPVTLAIHQNHDHSYYPGGWDAMLRGPESRRNFSMAPARRRRTLASATHRLTPRGIEPRRLRWLVGPLLARLRHAQHLWYRFMLWSKPFRYRIGLHRSRKVVRAQ
jgi:hypothetical protein